MHSHLAFLISCEALLFVLTMSLAASKRTALLGEYVGTGFHLLLMPIIAHVQAPFVAVIAGFLWVACDVIASTGLIWNGHSNSEDSSKTFLPVRMAGHLFAAIWIVFASYRMGLHIGILGSFLALGFVAYTLAAGRLPEKSLAVPGLLMLVWLLLLAWKTHQESVRAGDSHSLESAVSFHMRGFQEVGTKRATVQP